MLVKLEKDDILIINEYVSKYNCEMIHMLESIEAIKNENLKGDLLGFISENQLLGIFYFSEKKVLAAHYIDVKVTQSMALLKAIKHYRPIYIKGIEPVSTSLYHYIIRSLKNYKEDNCTLMIGDQEGFLEMYESKKHRENLLDEQYLKIISNWSEEAANSLNFIAEVEKYFGKQITSVNDISIQIKRQFEGKNYLLMVYKNECIAQVIIEMETKEFCLIGGLYVKPKYREMGIASRLLTMITEEIYRRHKKPILIVKKNNTSAINLYEKYGYKDKVGYTIMTIAI